MAHVSRLLVAALVTATLVVPASAGSAAAKPKIGGKCAVAKATTKVGTTKAVCTKVQGRLIWVSSKAVQAAPKPTPTPTPTPPSLTIEERWRQTESVALSIFDSAQFESLPATHSVNLTWDIHSSAASDVVAKVREDYDYNARFWSRFITITVPIKVAVAGRDQLPWICEVKLAWLKINQPDCVEAESGGPRHGRWKAGATHTRIAKINVYQIEDLAAMGLRSFQPRVAHEFFHNVQHAASPRYNETVLPCWAVEGGAEYMGILVTAKKDAELFLNLRNHTLQMLGGPDGTGSVAPEVWFEWLKKADRSGMQVNYDRCNPVRSEIYSHSILATEYLVHKLGINGLISLYKRAEQIGWYPALTAAFTASADEVYMDMAKFMAKEYDLVHLRGEWSFKPCYTNPPAPDCD